MLGTAAARSEPAPDHGEARDVTVSILVTDIVGSSELTERLGDEAWLQLLLAHNAIVRDRVWRHGGREVKARGDGFLLVFDRPVDAARCAISIQRALADYAERHPRAALRVRVGLHHGSALCVGEGFLGLNVSLTECMADAAAGGEILVSREFREMVREHSLQFEAERELRLAGLCGTHRVAALGWRRPSLAG